MTTRHVSAQNDYPFIPQGAATPGIEGILDFYLVVQGEPSYETAGEGSSSSEEPLDKPQQVFLVSYTSSISTTLFKFEARKYNKVWEIEFTVPHTGGDTGQVFNSDTTDCHGVLIFSSKDIIDTGSAGVLVKMEPARTQWHDEAVTSLTFANIARCRGIEDPEVILPEMVLGGASSEEQSLDWNDGYNCDVAYEDSSLVLAAGIGNGLGIAPDYGDTGSCSSQEVVEDLLEDTVTTINGLLPDNGNIPINTTASFGIQRSPGKIELIVKQ